MSNAKQETVADIVSEMRIGDLCADDTAARSMYINDFLASYADRIEAAQAAYATRRENEDSIVDLVSAIIETRLQKEEKNGCEGK